MFQSSKIQGIIFVLAVLSTGIYLMGNIVLNVKEDDVNDLVIKKYQQQAQIRIDVLKNNMKDIGYGEIYNTLVPEVFCIDLIRIGSIGDGGKWICNPSSISEWPKCNIYSLGINNEPSFEEDLQSLLKNKCVVKAVDKDKQSPETMERIKKINGVFKKALISGERNKSANIYRFNDILSEFGDERIDILKIDIEGAEFSILNELLSVRICQILIEVHGKTPKKTLEFLQAFSKNGYYLFSYEINGSFHHLSEYSFIHQSCFSVFNVKQIFGDFGNLKKPSDRSASVFKAQNINYEKTKAHF